MHLLRLFSLVLTLALAAFASVAARGNRLSSSAALSIETVKAMGVNLQSFLISDIYTQSLSVPATNASNFVSNTTISFVFSDPNSNTSTSCTDTWTETYGSSTAPFSYVLCSLTNVTEFFQWKFASYNGLDNFQMQFAHIFSDPVDFPPPFDFVEYFSAATNFTLTCGSATGSGGCQLPASLSPVRAVIDGMSD